MDQTTSNTAYELLLSKVAQSEPAFIGGLTIGLTWTLCKTNLANQPEGVANYGLAMTLGEQCRTLPWPGTVAGRPVGDISKWLLSWNNIEAAVGLAAINASINSEQNNLLTSAETIAPCERANLAVFEALKPQLSGKKVVVIGRYPGIAECLHGLDITILERLPGADDLPDTAAEFVIPYADWVFITASSLINKTFPRLAALAANAQTVLMGPSTPWLREWADFGIDYLAGVRVTNPEQALQITAEGGGVSLFGAGVTYNLARISA